MQTGAQQLRAWIVRSKFNNRQAAAFLAIPGIDEVVLNKILNAGRRPDLEKLIAIEEKTGVPMRAWATTPLDESAITVVADGVNRQ